MGAFGLNFGNNWAKSVVTSKPKIVDAELCLTLDSTANLCATLDSKTELCANLDSKADLSI